MAELSVEARVLANAIDRNHAIALTDADVEHPAYEPLAAALVLDVLQALLSRQEAAELECADDWSHMGTTVDEVRVIVGGLRERCGNLPQWRPRMVELAVKDALACARARIAARN